MCSKCHFIERDFKKERERAYRRWRGRGWKEAEPCLEMLRSEALHCSSLGFWEGSMRKMGAGDGGSKGNMVWLVTPHKLAEKAPTHWRNTSSLLRNLKKVGSKTSPRRRHVSVHVCWGSDTHTCREATGGHACGAHPALGDHTRCVELGDRASGLGGLCIAGLLVLGDRGADDVVQKSWRQRRQWVSALRC